MTKYIKRLSKQLAKATDLRDIRELNRMLMEALK